MTTNIPSIASIVRTTQGLCIYNYGSNKADLATERHKFTSCCGGTSIWCRTAKTHTINTVNNRTNATRNTGYVTSVSYTDTGKYINLGEATTIYEI